MTRPESKARSLLRRLHTARFEMIKQAAAARSRGDDKVQVEWERRRQFVDSLAESIDRARSGEPFSKSVFVSYSERTAAHYAQRLIKLLGQHGFPSNTGFDAVEHSDTKVLQRVLGRLEASTFFVGILTKEYHIEIEKGVFEFSPSVWVVEEKGMALARGMTCCFLIEKGVHPAFWQKTTPENLHHLFTPADFETHAARVVKHVDARYRAMMEEFVHGR